MDPRREVLRETLDLLKQEGWAPSQPELDLTPIVTDQHPSSSRRSLLTVVCVVSLAANVALVAMRRDAFDQAKGTRASLVLLSLKEFTFIEGSNLLLTVDGTEVWRRSPGEASSLEFKETVPVEFNTRCVVQLWQAPASIESEGKRTEMIAQSFITADQAGNKPVEVNLMVADGSHYRLLARVTKLPPPSSR